MKQFQCILKTLFVTNINKNISTDLSVSKKGIDKEWAKLTAELKKTNKVMPETKLKAAAIQKELEKVCNSTEALSEQELRSLQKEMKAVADDLDDSATSVENLGKKDKYDPNGVN